MTLKAIHVILKYLWNLKGSWCNLNKTGEVLQNLGDYKNKSKSRTLHTLKLS